MHHSNFQNSFFSIHSRSLSFSLNISDGCFKLFAFMEKHFFLPSIIYCRRREEKKKHRRTEIFPNDERERKRKPEEEIFIYKEMRPREMWIFKFFIPQVWLNTGFSSIKPYYDFLFNEWKIGACGSSIRDKIFTLVRERRRGRVL